MTYPLGSGSGFLPPVSRLNMGAWKLTMGSYCKQIPGIAYQNGGFQFLSEPLFMFGHSHCNANNTEVDFNIGQNYIENSSAPPPAKPPFFKPRIGKWRFLGFLVFGGGKGGRGRTSASRFYSVQDCYSIPQHRLWLPASWSRRTFKKQKWNSPLFMRIEGPQLLSYEGPLPSSEITDKLKKSAPRVLIDEVSPR